jgi:spermidine/putrescine transport system substrate-binding protein|tara:strand:- start:2738 stop:3781 length:1044 start_codon:yes stop_codon:yes gene_type:complete
MRKLKNSILISSVAASMLFVSQSVSAAGELNIYNWGDYTSPELITKFEETYNVTVTITDYDSNDTALAKVKAGGHGFDIAIPSANYMPIWISEGLLLETRPDQMSNFKNVLPEWTNPDWDPGRHYSVPYQWGSVGMVVNTDVYSGDINTSAIAFDPPEELVGKINVAPEMGDIIGMALYYVGSEPCTEDKAALKRARDVLMAAKPKWVSMNYSIKEPFASGDIAASVYWNGDAMRTRQETPSVHYGYPKEGYVLWMDSVVVLKETKNAENAKLFQNFMMEPENAALASNFAMYANGIKGSSEFMLDILATAPEVQIPAEHLPNGRFIEMCSAEVNKLYSGIWTEMMK